MIAHVTGREVGRGQARGSCPGVLLQVAMSSST